MFQQMIVPMNYETTRKFYATNEELIQDIGKAYQVVFQQFYDAGCRNLQLDDCTWGALVGEAAKQRYQALSKRRKGWRRTPGLCVRLLKRRASAAV